MPDFTVTPEFLAVARGDAPADLVFENARVVDVFGCEITPASVLVWRGRVAALVPWNEPVLGARRVDLGGAFIAPGLIDAHMHVESTMLAPSAFATLALPHGTTGAILDPHEIANVLGLPGVRWLMDDAARAPMHLRFGLSSCVPSCHLETSGARLEAADLAPMFDDPRVVALAEMMNFPGVVHADAGVLAKVNLGLSRRIVDGHAPGLRGRALQAYAAAGISSDHECTTLAEAQAKLRAGLRVFIREGSAAKNLAALLPAVTPANRTRFCFCTDDRHPADLRDQGHIDHVVRLAVARGLDLATAIAIGSFHTAQHYGLVGRGAVAPGYAADLIVFDDPRDFRPREVYVAGEMVAQDGVMVRAAQPAGSSLGGATFPSAPVRLPSGFGAASLRIDAPSGASAGSPPRIRVIGMDPAQLVTAHLIEPARVDAGTLVADVSRDILKLCVIERHRGGGNIGRGFVRGFGLARGAIASTVGHDAHNLAVLGTNDDDMALAARTLAEVGGGQCAVAGGRVLAVLPLPIAGLMSDQPAEVVIAQQAALLKATHELGCPHHDPFMPLSFMPLPVIPSLKLSDLGLVDVEKFQVVGLVV